MDKKRIISEYMASLGRRGTEETKARKGFGSNRERAAAAGRKSGEVRRQKRDSGESAPAKK